MLRSVASCKGDMLVERFTGDAMRKRCMSHADKYSGPIGLIREKSNQDQTRAHLYVYLIRLEPVIMRLEPAMTTPLNRSRTSNNALFLDNFKGSLSLVYPLNGDYLSIVVKHSLGDPTHKNVLRIRNEYSRAILFYYNPMTSPSH